MQAGEFPKYLHAGKIATKLLPAMQLIEVFPYLGMYVFTRLSLITVLLDKSMAYMINHTQ